MATPLDDDKFREIGEKAAETRRAAFESYSRAADLVRERIAAVEDAIRVGGTREAVENRRNLLSNAQLLKDLTERELDNADQNWREWQEEARAREAQDRLRSQETIAKSAAWAAWAAAITALISAGVAVWQAAAPLLRRPS